ncbi:hypothetical protein DM860_016761 [Cuscuta australis]|uniref:Uncharacterized protein n=1 Tax=Cuscuta australis TaxID=267555 RepID=A0A328DAF8_9ASTE|nr:hypothetical protein DM860_016761 [Cuscuta australis]
MIAEMPHIKRKQQGGGSRSDKEQSMKKKIRRPEKIISVAQMPHNKRKQRGGGSLSDKEQSMKKKKVRRPEKMISGSVAGYNQWTAPPVSGICPRPRFWHGAVVIQDKMYVYGGNCTCEGSPKCSCLSFGIHFLSDLHVLDLKTWAWLKLVDDNLGWRYRGRGTPRAGHSLIAWDNRLLLIAGHTKDSSNTILVKEFDLRSNTWLDLKTKGDAPIARGGHSVSLCGNSLVIFGGQDAAEASRLNDLHILDLVSREWCKPVTGGVPPAPRVDHAAAVYADRNLLIFGGSTNDGFCNDLHVFNLDSWEWSTPKVHGEIPTPRSGHAGATIGDIWYIVGGSSANSGPNTIVLNMSTYEWSVVTTGSTGHDFVGIEGLSLVVSSYEGEHVLVSFGGANLCSSSEVNVLKPSHESISKITEKVDSSVDDAAAPENFHAKELQYALKQLEAERLRTLKLEAEVSALKQKQLELHEFLVDAELNHREAEGLRLELLEEFAELKQYVETLETSQKELQQLRLSGNKLPAF